MIFPMCLVNSPPHSSLINSLIQCEDSDDHNKAPLLIQLRWSLIEFTIADKNP